MSKMLTAIVTGAGGQDGSYLSEYLLKNQYRVIGVVRRRSTALEYKNIAAALKHPNFTLAHGDITDSTFITRILHTYMPHEWYGLAANSHVGQSFKEPISSFKTNAEAVISQLEAIRQISPYTRFYNAGTSEIFGGIKVPETGYTEDSPLYPRSPYAVAKAAAFHATRNYREAYGLYACSGVLFNHSSKRRGFDFATRKITAGVASIKLRREKTLKMGDLSAYRDESHAEDMIRGMHLMLQQDEPEDFVLASGKAVQIKEMLIYVCNLAGLDFNDVYEKDERFMRPSDVPFLLGDATQARKKLGWKPTYTWKELLEEMYINDLENNVVR